MISFNIVSTRIFSQDFLIKFLLFSIFFSLVLVIYNNYLVDLYEYRGAGYIELDLYRLTLVFIVSLVGAFACPSELRSPGDLFLAIYIITVAPVAIILSGASLYGVESTFVYVCSLILSLIFLSLANRLKVRESQNHYVINHRLIGVLLAVNLLALFIVTFYMKGYFSLDYEGYPYRRDMAKLVFPGGDVRSYFISISVQALYPFFVVLACLTRKKRYLVIAIANVVVLWGSFGEKFPVIVSLFIFFCFYIYSKKGSLPLVYILLPFIGIMSIGAFEDFFTGYSYINDYILRRVYAVPSVLNDAVQSYSEKFGVNYYCDSTVGRLYCPEKTETVTYLLSDRILNLSEMNANVNFMAMAFLRMSYVGVFLEVSLLMLFIVMINYSFYKYSNWILLSIGLLLGIRLVEQSLLTSFVSSGILFVYLFALISMKKKSNGYKEC